MKKVLLLSMLCFSFMASKAQALAGWVVLYDSATQSIALIDDSKLTHGLIVPVVDIRGVLDSSDGVGYRKGDSYARFFTHAFSISLLDSSHNDGVTGGKIVVIKDNAGNLGSANISDLPFGKGSVTRLGLSSPDITITGAPATVRDSGNWLLTLPNINSNTGSYNNLTVNAKGQVTSASNTSYMTPISPATSGNYEFVKVDGTGRITAVYNTTVNTFDSSTRKFDSSYRPSDTTRTYDVDCSVTITIGATLLSSNNGVMVLETSPNKTTWTEQARIANSNSGLLGALNGQTSLLGTYNVPAGYYYRFRKLINTGTVAFINTSLHERLRR